jgi:thioredoxin 1
MNNSTMRILILVGVVAVAIAVFVMRPATQDNDVPTDHASGENLPRLVDLGADKCANCQKMVAILEGMREEQAAYFSVQFIDVWKNPEAAAPYAVKLIPTQIFLSADGKELFRHEGFFSRDDILNKWNELGVTTGSM